MVITCSSSIYVFPCFVVYEYVCETKQQQQQQQQKGLQFGLLGLQLGALWGYRSGVLNAWSKQGCAILL
jgi:hypothetical protein